MNTLPMGKQVAVVASLVEGNSIRSTERLTETHRDTIMRLGVRVGEGCAVLHDRLFRNLQVNVLEVDELWSFIGKKEGHCTNEDPLEFGDCYTFTGIDASRKAIVSYLVGRRDADCTDEFCADLRARIVNRPQITSDGFKPYTDAIEKAFGFNCAYAQLVKQYGGAAPEMPLARRYSPPSVITSERIIVSGKPDPTHISTSYIERSNLTVRMQNRRFTRLTNAYSKRWRNHAASMALWVCYYNLCWVHATLHTTPAMAMGITDHVWTIGELVSAALGAATPPETPIPPPTPPAPPKLPENSKWVGVPADRIPVGRVGTGQTKRPPLTVSDGGKK